jgi:cytochrome c
VRLTTRREFGRNSAAARSAQGVDGVRRHVTLGALHVGAILLGAVLVGACIGCRADPARERGRVAVRDRGCGVCHTIAGMPDASGSMGPTLTGIADRAIIAGRLVNTRANAAKWILDPNAIEPGVAMPPLGAADTQVVRDIVAYLYSLER